MARPFSVPGPGPVDPTEEHQTAQLGANPSCADTDARRAGPEVAPRRVGIFTHRSPAGKTQPYRATTTGRPAC